jgi:hypothetical protein
LSALKRLERKILRKIYVPIKDQNDWRILTEDELQVMYRKPNISRTVKGRRLEWVGHHDRTAKKVLLGTPGGTREAGRPKLRSLDCIENDLKSMGAKRWRKKTEGRSVWAIIMKEALVKL